MVDVTDLALSIDLRRLVGPGWPQEGYLFTTASLADNIFALSGAIQTPTWKSGIGWTRERVWRRHPRPSPDGYHKSLLRINAIETGDHPYIAGGPAATAALGRALKMVDASGCWMLDEICPGELVTIKLPTPPRF